MNYCKPAWNDRVIEAVKWDGHAATADAFLGAGNWQYAEPATFRDVSEIQRAVDFAVQLESPWRPSIKIRTLAGDARVEPGDYIVRGVSGKLQPVRGDVFERTYVQVD